MKATAKPAPKKRAVTVDGFLAEVETERRQTRCAVCDNKPVSAAVDEILAARKEGKTVVSAARVHRWLREQFRVPFSVSTLLLCCRTHRDATWSRHGN